MERCILLMSSEQMEEDDLIIELTEEEIQALLDDIQEK
jgi:hypothetical protein